MEACGAACRRELPCDGGSGFAGLSANLVMRRMLKKDYCENQNTVTEDISQREKAASARGSENPFFYFTH